MSQPPPPAQRSSSLEPSPQPTRRPSSTRSSVKSSARSVSKSLKNAFTKRKGKSDSLRAAGLRNGSDYDIASQRSGSIGPESFISNQSITEEEPRVSEEVMLDSGDPTYVSPFPTLSNSLLLVHVQAFLDIDDLTLFPVLDPCEVVPHPGKSW